MRLQVRGKLFVASVAAVLVGVLLTGLVAERELRQWLMAHLREDLAQKLEAVAVAVDSAVPQDMAHADRLADALGEALQARVTLVRADGGVLGDSRVSLAELPSTSNHADRPEIRAALDVERGFAERHSATVHEDMLYAARAVEGGAVRVARVAIPLVVIEEAAFRLRLLLGLAGLVGLGLAVAMSVAASQVLSRTLRRLVEHAQQLATGIGARPSATGTDELLGLRGTLDHLAAELRRQVATLAEERERMGAVLDAMDEGVLAFGEDERALLVNPAARRLLDVDGDPLGRTLLELVRIPALADLVAAARDGRAGSVEVELGSLPSRALLARAAPARARGAVLVLHDVTEVRRLERVRRDFVANVSHELRTPVSVIRANAETLLLGALGDRERAASFVEAIDRNAERLAHILGDLLDLSRIEAGQQRVDLGELPLLPLCQRVQELFRGRAEKRQQTLVLEVDEALSAWADASALEQVLVNLLDNALKYTPPGGRVVLRARRVGERCRVEVEDDGPGIEPHHWPRLFERFYRVDAGRSRDAGGTGLGLAIVKHLAEAQGGQVGVGAAPRRGSLFWVELPAPNATQSAPA